MGGASSQESYSGYLYIETLQPFFHSGDTIQGTVHLYLTQPIQAQELMLKFKTKEKWVINPNRNGTYQEFKRIRIQPQFVSEKTTISQKYPIFNFSGSTGPGQFSFPFTLTMASNVPGTCNIDDNVCIGSIRNQLIAYVKTTQRTVKKFNLPLVIMQTCSRPLHSGQTFAVSTGCCSSSGSVTLSIAVDNNAYRPGEEIGVSVEIDNSQSAVPIGAVTVGLYRIIDVAMETGPAHYRKSTLKEMIMNKVIPAGQALMAERKLHLRLPTDINPATVSARGQTMLCYYTIDVCPKLVKGWMFGSANPVLSHRVTIQPREPMFLAPPAIPVAWNPEVLPVTLLSLDENFHAPTRSVGQ